MAESMHINVGIDDFDEEKMHGNNRGISRSQKVHGGLERIILIVNFILELPSAAFDQLSSAHKPQYALLSMLMSFIVLIICIIDFAQKCRKERVKWMIKGLIPWFYYPYPNPKPFGTSADIVGLICAVFQCVFTSIAYAFLSQQSDNPIKINVWPIVFSFVLLYSKLSGNPPPKTQSKRSRCRIKVDKFTLAELVAATDNFSDRSIDSEMKFGYVYRGYLRDNRCVEIWRYIPFSGFENRQFETQLEILTRLKHKHLVRLAGYCEEGEMMLLVFEDMKNTSLYNLLHKNNSSFINSWKMRIKIGLEAARGIEYLHIYAVPPIIHGDVKSSKVLVDENMMARVSGFEFSLMVPQLENVYDYERMIDQKNFIGPMGFVDGYFDVRKITAKYDVYSFGVVLLELLTGKMPYFWDGKGKRSRGLVDFALHKFNANELMEVLDRVGPPELNEVVAVELLANTAISCVEYQGENRPNVSDVVANLEEALSLCDRHVKA